jgi:hypothetical protein
MLVATVTLRNDSGGTITIGPLSIGVAQTVTIWDTISFSATAAGNFQAILDSPANFNENVGNSNLVMAQDGGADLTPSEAFALFHTLQEEYVTRGYNTGGFVAALPSKHSGTHTTVEATAILVQSTTMVSASDTASFNFNFSSNIAAGNTVVVLVAYFNKTTPLTVTAGGDSAALQLNVPNAQGEAINAYVVASATGGSAAVSVTAGSNIYLYAVAQEWSGLDTSSLVNQAVVGSDTTNPTLASTTTGPLGASRSLVYAVISNNVTVSPSEFNPPFGFSLTPLNAQNWDNIASSAAAYKIVESTVPLEVTWGPPGNYNYGSSGVLVLNISEGGSSDLIDGDQLDISWAPANYTRTTAPAEVTSTSQLTAHLAGIDAALGSSTFADNEFRIQDEADTTKQLAFQVSGITTATTRTITVPNANITIDDASNPRPPTSHATSHNPGGGDALATAAPPNTAVQIGNAAAVGTAASFSRSDHVHAVSAGTPVNVTKAANAAGSATTFARSDHKHDITTAAAVAATVGQANAEGTSTSLARADHTHAHAAGTPVNVTKAANAAGSATTFARSDHKHDITTAAAVAVGTANAEGSSTSLARADHTHQVTGLVIASEAQGDILYRNASAWVRLAAGTANQFLQTAGAAANPVWAKAVRGAASSTDNAIVRWDGTGGDLAQNSTAATVDDSGRLSVLAATFGSAEYSIGNVTGTLTINWNNGQMQSCTLTGNVTTVSMTAPPGIGRFSLRIIQGGSGSYTVTGYSNVKFPQGIVPALGTAVGTEHIITFEYRGAANYYAVATKSFS